MLSVILPVYIVNDNLAQLTKDCLFSLFDQYDELIIIDDGSVKMNSWLRERADIYVYHQKNKGFSVSANHGFRLASGDHICLVCNDTRLERGKLLDLIPLADEGYGFPTFVGKSYPLWDGAVFMFSREVLNKNGVYDEKLKTYFSDTDLFYRARVNGFNLSRSDDVVFLHHESQTTKATGIRDGAYKEDNELFIKKWGFDPLDNYSLEVM